MFRRVDAALKLKGMTRGDLAKAIGVTPSTLSLKLNGKAPITLQEARAIKKALDADVTIEELFADTETRPA